MIIYSTPKNASSLTKAVKDGKIHQIAKGVYTDKVNNEQIINNIFKILTHLNVDGIISYGSSLYENYFDDNNILWMVGKTERKIILNNLKIIINKGNSQELNNFGTEIIENTKIRVPNIYRAILQNYSKRKVDLKKINRNKSLELLIKEEIKIKNNSWDILISNFKMHAKELKYDNELLLLLKDIEEYKKNKNLDLLDSKRVLIFDNFYNLLEENNINVTNDLNHLNKIDCENMAFFEAYFSNYIEGTEFEISEAYNIIYDPSIHYVRAKDSHDIKNTYKLILENINNPINIQTPEEYIKTIKFWHKNLMQHRTDEMLVGEFKNKKNKAGSTSFVSPDKVMEMLIYSFNISKKIIDPYKKALFLKLCFTEIHPFEDGNGRISRLILNNFFSLNKKRRIIIPNVFREDYILPLKAFSNNNNLLSTIKMLNKAIQITNSIPYNKESNEVINYLNNNSAFCLPNESMWGTLSPKNNSEVFTDIDVFSQNISKNKF